MKYLVLITVLVLCIPCHPARAGAPTTPCVPGKVEQYEAKVQSLRTGYYPDDSDMEGGYVDREGKPLQTLKAYLAGKAPYVSVAMDGSDDQLPYGTVVRIPAVELAFHKCIEFRIVDTGDRFEGKGTDKVDICNDTEDHSLASWTNGIADLYLVGHKN